MLWILHNIYSVSSTQTEILDEADNQIQPTPMQKLCTEIPNQQQSNRSNNNYLLIFGLWSISF